MPTHPQDDEDVKATLKKLVQKVSRIETGLFGDKPLGLVGLVDRQDDTERRVDDIMKAREAEANQKKGMIWLAGAVGSVAGAIGAFATWASGLFPHGK